MKIEFQQVVPHPLKGQSFGSESVWGNDISLDSTKRYLLYSDSGKGKSTFVAYLMGIRSDFDGKVMLDGRAWDTITLDEKSVIRSEKLAFIPQDLQLFPKLTALENLQIKNQLKNAVTDSELANLLNRFGLKDQTNQTCGTLSKGQQQRVALIRALIQPFDFLVLDEPFSHLDEGNIAIGRSLIEEYTAKNNAGFLLASLGSDYGFNPHQSLHL